VINVCFSCFYSLFFFCSIFCFAFAFYHHHCYNLLCYIAFRLVLLLFGVVCHSLSCIIVVYCGASSSLYVVVCCGVLPLPYVAIVVCCGSSSLALHYCYLLWCIVPHFALLLLVVVHCPLSSTIACVIYDPLLCVVTCCGVSFFTLHCCCLLWFVTLALRYCCFLLWFIILHALLPSRTRKTTRTKVKRKV
jgi:hypothetical protein